MGHGRPVCIRGTLNNFKCQTAINCSESLEEQRAETFIFKGGPGLGISRSSAFQLYIKTLGMKERKKEGKHIYLGTCGAVCHVGVFPLLHLVE